MFYSKTKANLQRKMPMSKATNAYSGAPDLALAIALPGERRATRFPTYPNIERTATLSTLSTGTLSIGGGTNTILTFFRSPVYPLWTRQAPGAFSQTMMWGFSSLSANDRNTLIFDSEPEFYSTSLSTMPYPILGSKDAHVWIYCPQGLSVGWTLNPSASASWLQTFLVEVFDGIGTFQREFAATTTGGAGTLISVNTGVTFDTSVWIRPVSLELASNATMTSCPVAFGVLTGGTIGNPNGGATITYPLFYPPEFNNSTLPYGSSRANAVSLLLSNVTAVLNKEGTVRATRVPFPGIVNPWGLFNASAAFTTSHPDETYWGPLENGFYTFALPDSSSSRFRKHFSRALSDSATPYAVPLFPLDGVDYATLILLSDLGTNDSQMAVSVDSHLEFRTSSSLFSLGYTKESLESLHQAQVFCAQKGFFFENPSHVKSIIKGLGTALAKVGATIKRKPKPAPQKMKQKQLLVPRVKGGKKANKKKKGGPTPQRRAR